MSPPTHEPISAASVLGPGPDPGPGPGPGIASAVADITSIPASPPIIPSSPISEPEPEPEPEPELRPLIAEVLRTRYCAPGSVVLVEGVDVAHTSPHTSRPSGRKRRRSSGGESQSHQGQSQSQRRQWRAIRLLLGDGELCVQALLAPEMHPYVDAGEVAVGAYIRLERFRIEWLEEDGGADAGADADVKGKGKERESDPAIQQQRGERVVYLIVEDLVVVGWSKALVQMTGAGDADLSAESELEDDLAMMDEDEEEPQRPSPSPSPSQSPSQSPSRAREERRAIAARTVNNTPRRQKAQTQAPQTEPLEGPVDAIAGTTTDSDFKTMRISRQEKTEQHRTATSLNPQTAIPSLPPQPPPAPPPLPVIPRPTRPRPRQIINPTQPQKLTPLKSIPHLPYKQNWSMNVLAVITYVSGLEPSGIPPYTNTQRRARLADPSTSKRVLLTVFLDAEEFAPAVGSVVLLLGVKNHRFEGGCLKMYWSDRRALVGRDGMGGGGGDGKGREEERQRWWFENPVELGWCDVAGLKGWWEGEQRKELQLQEQQQQQQ